MGDYSYGDHLEIFGGPPEPGEAYPDLEQVDLLRKEQKENPPPRGSHAGCRCGENMCECDCTPQGTYARYCRLHGLQGGDPGNTCVWERRKKDQPREDVA